MNINPYLEFICIIYLIKYFFNNNLNNKILTIVIMIKNFKLILNIIIHKNNLQNNLNYNITYINQFI
jgi:hypothetical protein